MPEITDNNLLEILAKQNLSEDDVILERDFTADRPKSRIYGIKKSRKKIVVIRTAPMVNHAGQVISTKWLQFGNKFVADKNLFECEINNELVSLSGDEKIASWSPQIIHNNKVVKPIGSWLVKNGESVLEMDYGICKRRLILRRSSIAEFYIFENDPKGDVHIKSNYQGTLKPSSYWGVDGKHRLLKGFSMEGDKKIINAKIFEQAVFPIIVDDTVEFSGSTDDGYVINVDEDYEVCHDAANGKVAYTAAAWAEVGQEYDGDEYNIRRGMFFFDTSDIPDDAVITASYISIRFTSAGDPTDSNYDIYKYYGAQPPTIADFDGPFADYLGGIDSEDIEGNENQYHNISLQDAVPPYWDWINVTGVTKLGFRSSRDVDDIPPAEDDEAYCEYDTANAGASKEPLFYATYATSARPLVNGSLANVSLVNGVLVR